MSNGSSLGSGNGAGDRETPYRVVGTRTIRPDGVEKVTGRANYGADQSLPGMLWGHVIRSEHAHAKILSIDPSEALKLDGVQAFVTGEDMPSLPAARNGDTNFRDLSRNILARGKALYHGHAIAAVAASTRELARRAASLVKVTYEVLPPVLDVLEAAADNAPILLDDLVTQGIEPAPTKPTNIAARIDFQGGDTEQGFADAELVIEREFRTPPVHQGYIEPQACLCSAEADGKVTIWCSSQGHFMVRTYTAKVLQMEASKIRVIPAEIGGGFGGKTTIYLEPVAVMLSKRTGRPVKMVMSREEVFRATGPTSGSHSVVKLGCTKEGKICAATAVLHFEAGAFPGSPVMPAAMTMFAPYQIENFEIVGYDVVVNKPKVAAYRAPGAPIGAFGVECILDEMATRLKIDPIDLRLANAAEGGVRSTFGPKFKRIGFIESLEAARAHPHYSAPLGPHQGRGVAAGFWFNGGMQSTAAVNINEDGTVSVISGSPDIGGSRASLAIMAAEELGIDYDRISPVIADTNAIGFNDLTGGSRTTHATGMAVIEACREVIAELCRRAAIIMEVEESEIVWSEGEARHRSDPGREPISLAGLAAKAARMGGPICCQKSLTARGVGMAFAVHICDVEVDEETGRIEVVRYTAVQDVGRAIHPSYVEGQMQGGVAQGIGWALNEEYVHDADGKLENPLFLDYRMPVASDLPMIDTVIIEVPNPGHPYGVRGVGEVPIVPPIPAVVNAVYDATKIRFEQIPLSPPRVLEALGRRES